MNGKLIVIEGLDGSGKATQTKLLYEALREKYNNVIRISFPDYSQPSSSLVKMYLNSEFGDNPDDVNAYAASSFFAVDRYASYMKFWKKNYKNGDIVLADRYSTSNCTFQMSKLDKSEWDAYLEWFNDYEYSKLGLPVPDVVIYLDMPTEVSQKLMNKRYHGDECKKDLHESNIKFLKSCGESAMYSAKKFNWNIVECSKNGEPRSIDDIHSEIIDIVERMILRDD